MKAMAKTMMAQIGLLHNAEEIRHQKIINLMLGILLEI
ncbi:hypothetical protein MNB_SM-6-1083 [hydrothermal vent metagenome]|uniref:Uncharacterized protein n=1 Tax=hydrothermal vent metagenome TaxID=652676 RepID=A0A1W1CSV7_9ZZZZ